MMHWQEPQGDRMAELDKLIAPTREVERKPPKSRKQGLFTNRQAQVMEMLRTGVTVKESAFALGLTYGTVKMYMLQASKRTQSKTSNQLMARYMEWRFANAARKT